MASTQHLTVIETASLRRVSQSDTVVRPPSELDVSSLAALFSEMQSHYARPVSDEVTTMAAKLACRPPVEKFDPRALVALKEGRIVGSIILNVTFPAFELTLSLHIRDLYVAKAARRCGVGRTLVNAAARLAVREGFSALEWTTDATNTAARQMYEVCGAKLLARVYYRLCDETLRHASA